MSETVALSGTVEDVFGHRFTLKTLDGKHLVDLGPDAEHIVEAGQQIDLKGDRKPSEIRARSIRVGQAVWQDLTGAGKQPPHGSRSSQGDRKHDGDKTDGHGQDDGACDR